MINNIKTQKTFYASLFILFLVNLFLHLYKLDAIPYAIHIDEAGLWYNVQSLIKHGTDQAGKSWPLLFANYHSEQSAMYTYLALICCKIFGESLFTLRLPAVLNMAVIFIFGNKIVGKIFNNEKINIAFSILITLCPYFVLSGRMALDCNLMLGFSTMFLWFFLTAIDRGRCIDATIAGIICGLTLYTYVLSYVSIPLFLIFSIIYLWITKKITWKQIIAFAAPILLLAIPLILIQIINVFKLQEMEVFGITLSAFDNPRHDDLNILSIFTNFATPFLYILLTPQRLYECIVTYGNFQWVIIPFLLIGMFLNIIQLFKHNTEMGKRILTIWWSSVYFTCMLVYKDLTTWHLNGLMFVSVLFVLDGIVFLFQKIKEKNTKIFASSLVTIIFAISTVSFMFYYYCGDYAKDEANSYYVYEDLTETLNTVDELNVNQQNVYILLPSVLYRVSNDIPYFNPQSTYTNSKENVVFINDYYFDMGAKSLHNPDELCIYVVHQNYEDYLRVLNDLSFNQTQSGSYIIFWKRSNNS